MCAQELTWGTNGRYFDTKRGSFPGGAQHHHQLRVGVSDGPTDGTGHGLQTAERLGGVVLQAAPPVKARLAQLLPLLFLYHLHMSAYRLLSTGCLISANHSVPVSCAAPGIHAEDFQGTQ